MKAVCSKSEEVSLFGEVKYDGFSYTDRDMKVLEKCFGEKVRLLDYNFSKSPPQDGSFAHDETYVLRVKDKHAILYVK